MASFKNAAYQVLKKANKPLHSKEITKIALRCRFLKTSGKTPEATMGTILYTDIKKHGKNSRFIRTAPSTFAINPKYSSEKTKYPQPTLTGSLNLNYWVMRMGRGGKYVNRLLDKSIIALGWSKISPLAKYRNFLYLIADVERLYPDGATAQTTGQLWRFFKEIKKGDLILVPVPFERKIIISKIVSDYFFKEERVFDYPHRRKVEILKTISRDDCSQQLKFSLGSLLTVFSINNHREEINALIESTARAELARTHKNIYDAVISRLFELEAREFEKFIRYVLNLVGFEAAITDFVGDKGVDVVGSLNAEGLAQIKLKVQVKRIHNTLGIDEVLRTRGTLAPDEHGCIITLSSFTKKAIEEAEDERKKPISLIDGPALVDLILGHYEDIDAKHKDLIGVKPKKIPLDEKFLF